MAGFVEGTEVLSGLSVIFIMCQEGKHLQEVAVVKLSFFYCEYDSANFDLERAQRCVNVCTVLAESICEYVRLLVF